jgi:GTP pyrophosphokinase
LHTTVVGPSGDAVEIQIRTREMHDLAEYGIAAHWKYKENGDALRPHDEARFTWLRQLMEWQQDLDDPTDFIESVKVDLFGDEIFVYTPRGAVKVLPEGATPVDFAYSIHTEVGHTCTGAKVNAAMSPLRQPAT